MSYPVIPHRVVEHGCCGSFAFIFSVRKKRIVWPEPYLGSYYGTCQGRGSSNLVKVICTGCIIICLPTLLRRLLVFPHIISITTCIMLPATSETSVLELGKWTKPMLIDFILNKTLPSDLKVSDSLLSHLNTNNLEPESSDNTANVATILQSVVIKLKNISESNRLINVKLNSITDSNSNRMSPVIHFVKQ